MIPKWFSSGSQVILEWFPSDSKVKEVVSDDWIKERMGMKRKERKEKEKDDKMEQKEI